MLQPISLKELRLQKFPDARWLVERLIPLGGITIISGHPGTGKSMLMLEIAHRVSTGQLLFDKFDTTKSSVLYIDEENNARDQQERSIKLGIPDDSSIRFSILKDFKIPADTGALMVFCHDNNIGVVIFDSLVRIHSSDENDAKEMSKIFHNFRLLTESGVTVLIIHHNRKANSNSPSSQDMRGSSDILAAADCHIQVALNDDVLTISQQKLRQSSRAPRFQLTFSANDEKYEFRFSGSEVTQQEKRQNTINALIKIIGSGTHNQSELLEKLHLEGLQIQERSLRDLIKRLESSGKIIQRRTNGNSKVYELCEEDEKT